MKKPEVAQAFHGLVMVAGCGIALASFIGAIAFNDWFDKGKKSTRGGVLRGPLLTIACGLPVALFAAFRGEALAKLMRAFVKEDLFPQLVLPLRVLALIAAGDTMPRAFKGLQLASIVSRTVSDTLLIANISHVVKSGQALSFLSRVDSFLLADFLPSLIGILWLVGSLRNDFTTGTFAIALGVYATPAILSKSWPPLAVLMGLEHKKLAHELALLQLLSLTQVVTALLLFIVSGALSMLVGAGLFQIIIRIHGTEAFAAILPQN
jgi:hypothetical protein